MKISEQFRKQLRKRPKRGETDSMIIHDALDDIDTLEYQLRDAKQLIEADNAALKKAESRLKWAEALLERAKVEIDRVVAYAPATEAEEKLASEFLSDLAKGFPGGVKE